VVKKENLKYLRHGHAVSCIKDKFLVVSGSKFELRNSDKSVEFYDIEKDLWFE
jgi:hypothetical protein